MFCPKCGTKALDGATFCQKCGAKLTAGDTVQQAAASTSVQHTQTSNASPDTPKKKKSKKLPIIIGAVALAIVAVIVIAMNWDGKIDYEATVRAHQPFVSQGTSLTYGEVLDKYITPPDWKVRHSGEVNYVDISGKAKGTDNELVVTIKVTEDPSDPDLASISPESVTIDGKKSPTQNDAVEFLLAMFLMYEEGYDNISDLFSETQSPNTVDVNYEGVSLSQLLDLPADEVIALLGPPVVHDEYKLAYDTIEFELDGGRITSAESFNPEKFLISGTPLAQNRSMLPALLGEPTHEGEGGSGYEMTFDMDGYVLTIATGDKDGAAWRIFITPNNEVETGNQSRSEVLYNGYPVAQLLGSKLEELNQIFGAPTDTGILYGATEYYTYNDISFMLDDQGAAVNITVAADAAEINGASLGQNRTGIINLLGTPGYEELLPEDESGEGFGGYYIMEYTSYEDLIIMTVQLPDADSKAYSVTISRYDDGPGDEEYTPAAQMDASLYGRWRAADGTSIAFDEYGGAQTSMELRPWWAIGKSTALSWEASNGQLKLITSYSAEYKYTYYPDTGEVGSRADQLQVGSLFLHRVNGNTGDSMIGVWDDNDMGGPYFTFNADGTGAFANDKSTTWVADDENVYIYYSLYSTYDYYVSGDMLELFFSDGSKTFIKVGN